MQDRRNTERQKTYFGARIEQTAPFAVMNGLVRNFSGAGARVAVHNAPLLAERFSMVIAGKDRRVTARIIWRNFDEVGVVFEEGAVPGTGPQPMSSLAMEEKLRASEARCRQLEARLNRMCGHS